MAAVIVTQMPRYQLERAEIGARAGVHPAHALERDDPCRHGHCQQYDERAATKGAGGVDGLRDHTDKVCRGRRCGKRGIAVSAALGLPYSPLRGDHCERPAWRLGHARRDTATRRGLSSPCAAIPTGASAPRLLRHDRRRRRRHRHRHLRRVAGVLARGPCVGIPRRVPRPLAHPAGHRLDLRPA